MFEPWVRMVLLLQVKPLPPNIVSILVSSRGTERQKIDRQHLVTTKEGEKVIMNQLRSSREFNRNMKDLIARLFY